MKVLTVVGARPQFIKAAPVSAALRGRAAEVMVHTGQHYDEGMSAIFFRDLDLGEPAHNLGAGSGSHAAQTSRILAMLEPVLLAEHPDVVLVFGDTNSTLAGALAAAKLGIPVGHVEAGLRSGDRTMPEEVNRIVADHVASVCYAPSAVAVANLRAEGLGDTVVEIGDVMVDALNLVTAHIPAVPEHVAARGVAAREYIVATVHRAATTDDAERLRRAVDILVRLPLPTFVPLHPRTRAALLATRLLARLENAEHVVLLPPLGYAEMVGLVARARAVLTDSGGIQKEAYVLGTKCITLRSSTEWPETLVGGWNRLVDLDADAALSALATEASCNRPAVYGDGRAAVRLADDLVRRFGTAG